jgi:parvulin-like peptidyl-prolyl isomerase
VILLRLLRQGAPFLFVVGALAGAAACRSTTTPPPPAVVSPDTWAVVDGHAITRDAVDKAYRRIRNPGQTISDEEALTAKLSVLNDLIVQQILLTKAAALKIDVPQAELDTAYANARKNMTDAAFTEELKKRNLTADDMRDGLRREMLTQKLIEQEVSSKIVVTDQEVSGYYDANRADFNVAEEAYHIAQLVITPVREAQITNQSGDDAATPQAAVAKTKMLMERLKAGDSFRDLAVAYSEDPESAPRGGDLGLVPVSRLKAAPEQLRKAVLGKTPGAVNVATAGGAYTLVLVIAHEQAGQRDLSTAGVRERITETLKSRREQLLRAAYLTAARSDASVVNYLARKLVEAKGAAAPSLLPAAPGR